ncbi:MAG: zinc-ribbon and DUF3426 domain-containing protein [Piscinibacter sp.]|nr:zinc-ribbon and DUF3426 domain-containing protein [Piscinibacter sp.]
MSLATRCTSCGTVFRVVQDQLKVSEGWVRCGRCDSVFNALEGLFDLDRDPPPEWTESPSAAAHAAGEGVDVRLAAPDDERADSLESDPSLVDRIDEQIFGSGRRSAFGTLGVLTRAERREPEFADARFDSETPGNDSGSPLLIDPTVPESEPVDDSPESPTFVRDAERARRWESSRTRKLLALLVLLLALFLGGQAVHHQRDELVARWPTARSPMNAWCEVVGCTLAAPRHLEDIVVESTALARGSSAESFRLSVVLRNRGTTVAAAPWIELSLTDANGELVARRALSPGDLNAGRNEIDGGGDLNLLAALSTGTSRITGYTVEIFYP